MILQQCATQALSPQRTHRYELTIVIAEQMTFKRCNVLNPATLLPVPSDAELHRDCAKAVFHSKSLWDQLLGNSIQPFSLMDLHAARMENNPWAMQC